MFDESSLSNLYFNPQSPFRTTAKTLLRCAFDLTIVLLVLLVLGSFSVHLPYTFRVFMACGIAIVAALGCVVVVAVCTLGRYLVCTLLSIFRRLFTKAKQN